MHTQEIIWNKGSFRDPDGSVFVYENEIYRSVKTNKIVFVKNLLESNFFAKHIKNNNIIGTTLKDKKFDFIALHHEKIPFINYPYEWSFNMLKEAAILTLDILSDALNEGFILKDGSAWNLTYYNSKMIFFDVLSIGEYKENQMWDGYRQFCYEFLFPLMIKAYKNLDFQKIFKGSLNGIDIGLASSLFGFKDFLKPGVFKHVYLASKLEKQKTIEQSTIKNNFKLPKNRLLKIVSDLKNLINKLEIKNQSSLWNNYTNCNTYTDADTDTKKNFIKSCFEKNKKIIDIGCNTGFYSFALSKNNVIYACDLDTQCIDNIFIDNKKKMENITPFVLDLMNPSSNCGWDLKERDGIFKRLKVDGFIALALIHHICISSNVPIMRFIEFLNKIAHEGVLEWVEKTDPMVKFLLRNREDIFDNYNWEHFCECVNQYFHIEKIQVINNGDRKLCFIKKKN